MVRQFDDDATRAARGLQIWQILVGNAHNRQTMTYGELAKVLGFKGAGTMAHMLGHVFYFCKQNDLPPLTALVVNQETGLPGEGLTGVDLNKAREAVYSYMWYSIWPPTTSELHEAFEQGFNAVTDSGTEN